MDWFRCNKPDLSSIYSNSSAASDAVSGGRIEDRPDIVRDSRLPSMNGEIGCEVIFMWIPGHSGILGILTADD